MVNKYLCPKCKSELIHHRFLTFDYYRWFCPKCLLIYDDGQIIRKQEKS